MESKKEPAANKCGLNASDFQCIVDGKQTDLYILSNTGGMEVALTNYGCALLGIMVPDREGQFGNVILSYGNIRQLLDAPEPFLSTTIGRYANRICKGKFHLDGKTYQLAINNGPNALHGGPTGFHARVWDVKEVSESAIVFTYRSEDMEEGFPGNLDVEVRFSVTPDNSLEISYKAQADQTTIVNLTNHGFFNLGGTADPSPDILDNDVVIKASHFLPIDPTSIPTGEVRSVLGTPFDFLTPHTIGERIFEKDEQLTNGTGYDHCYVLDKDQAGTLSLAAICHDPKSGRIMEMLTTEPGVQIYTGNFLSGFQGAHGATFPRHTAICFEAQKFPDTPNRAYFPSAVLEKGQTYSQTTIYRFKTDKD